MRTDLSMLCMFPFFEALSHQHYVYFSVNWTMMHVLQVIPTASTATHVAVMAVIAARRSAVRLGNPGSANCHIKLSGSFTIFMFMPTYQ